MSSSLLRRAFFERLFLNLALILGLLQGVVWHWWIVVVRGDTAPGVAQTLGMGALLVAVNGCAFPLLRRHRRRSGLVG